ncbi:MAG: alpha/beta hydrolase [Anaerolineae bacterium]|nr:alpha/beta hydrolase [Anaerolineae bacterium]
MKKLFLLLAFCLLMSSSIFAQEDTLPAQDLADPDGAFVTLDGVEFYYIALGDEDAPVVMLLHGFGGSTFTWHDNMGIFAEAGYRVVVYDRPPFGLSDKTPNLDLSPSTQADQAIALMDALNIETATFVGHSAGGGVISYIAAQYPERADALIFVAGAVPVPMPTSAQNPESTPEPNSGGSPIGGIAGMAANLDPENPMAQNLVRQFLTPERFVGILISAYHPSFEVTQAIRDGYARVLRVNGWEGALISLFQAREGGTPINLEAFALFDKSILIIWGEEDTWVPLRRGEAIHAFFPQSRLVTYPNVGHMPMEEATDSFNADVLTFLTDVYSD